MPKAVRLEYPAFAVALQLLPERTMIRFETDLGPNRDQHCWMRHNDCSRFSGDLRCEKDHLLLKRVRQMNIIVAP